jgi:ABC-type multidrug transport system fused ATPase/permease subunit
MTMFFRFLLFRHIIYQDMSYFDTLSSKGKLTNTLTDDLLKMKEGIGDKVADFLSLLARMIGCLTFALITGWKLTAVVLSIAPLVIVAFNLTIKFTIKYTKEQMEAYGKANSIAQEILLAIRTVTAFNGQRKEHQRCIALVTSLLVLSFFASFSYLVLRYADSLSTVPSIGLKKGIVQGLYQIFSNIAIGLVFTGALCYGQYLIKTECHRYSAGRLVAVCYC